MELIYERNAKGKIFTFVINRTGERKHHNIPSEVIFSFKNSSDGYVNPYDAIVLKA